MTGKEYQELAMRTAAIPEEDSNNRLRHGVFGLCSEAGEVAAIMQKVYQGKPFDVEHMKKEVSDVLWFVAQICNALGTDIDEIFSLNIEKLKARFPEGFEVERDQNRAEGDI